jgi:hypothetical protein
MAAKRISIKANVSSRASASEYLKRPGDAVIVERQGPRWLIMMCPCGCGAQLPINLDGRAGPAWRLYVSRKAVSLYPSVWRDSDCKSHFIIRRNKIVMMQPRGAGRLAIRRTNSKRRLRSCMTDLLKR